jgi:hypothetical protein
MRQHRPTGFRGAGDAHQLPLSRDLGKLLWETQRTFRYETLHLKKADTAKLAEILVEFAEDIHNGIGLWDAYESYNRDFFGVALPFARPQEALEGVSLARIRHLLWELYPELKAGLVVSPYHADLEHLAQAAHRFLADRVQTLPRGSGVKAFLETSNEDGGEVKRKLIWLGTCSYMFRLFFTNYLAGHNRGRWDIGHVDDFVCQECTRWSGLGVIDVLARVLPVSDDERQQLRSWYERHASFYRIQAASDRCLEVLNIVSKQPYQIRIDMPDHPFRLGQLVFGSLVPWRGDWYWSGEQELWDSSAPIDEEGLRDTMRRQSAQVLCRFWEEYRLQVQRRAANLHHAALAFHGTDLVVYPDGLAMAADWQKELRASWESFPPEQVRDVVRRHSLKQGRPDMRIPRDLRDHDRGIGVFLNPEEGKEIMTEFDAVVAGLKRRGRDLTSDEEDAIQAFVEADAVSPAFVRRVVAEYGSESVRAAFRLPEPTPDYWLECLLRSRKGHFYRKRYPTVSVV